MANSYYPISPYTYCANNPVRFIDPNGMFFDDYLIREDEKRITLIKQSDNVDRIFDKDNPTGLEIEKGSFDLEEYLEKGYKVETLKPVGMAMTDIAFTFFGGELAVAKIGSWIGKGVSAWKASRAAKAVETTAEVGINAAKTSMGSGEFLFNTWHKGTFANRTQSVMYHVGKHGNGRTAVQYTEDAMSFFNKNKGLGQNMILKDGTQGIKVQTKQIINDKTQRVGGYWTADGKLVTFWD